MASASRSLTAVIDRAAIEALARPADVRYGEAIYRRGGVTVIAAAPERVDAWVGGLDGTVIEGGSQRRRTTLWLTEQGLAWHCAGNPKQHQVFCKLCVALALQLLDGAARHTAGGVQ